MEKNISKGCLKGNNLEGFLKIIDPFSLLRFSISIDWTINDKKTNNDKAENPLNKQPSFDKIQKDVRKESPLPIALNIKEITAGNSQPLNEKTTLKPSLFSQEVTEGHNQLKEEKEPKESYEQQSFERIGRISNHHFEVTSNNGQSIIEKSGNNFVKL
ncbi:hypothetical protein [Niallia sp. 01092]|uniref:hypothetical protein n=1 Tax=unclassified Niallia TaxID=2837522 RepID=UPI003FD3B26F